MTVLCAGLLLLLGCAPVKGPAPDGADVVRYGRIAVLPIVNLSNSLAPLAAIRRTLSEKLLGRGLEVIEEAELERFMASIRMRDTGGVDTANASALKEDAGAAGVLITALELYDDGGPPKIALSARLVSTGSNPVVQWADNVSIAGNDAPGLFGLGLIDDVNILINQATTSLVDSLVNYVSAAPEGSRDKPREGFGPKSAYVSEKAGVGFREVVVDFVQQYSSDDENTKTAKIDVQLSTPSYKNVRVEYGVAGGTAVRGKNYDLKDGSLT
ncbi:MAG: hypothetical protein HGA43_02510, partial [Nitrospirae bacterium]|nr:hypothetical protein [Nitrospirota bacterium]